MAPDLLFHPEARDEYENARAWYRSRSWVAATRFEAEVDRTLALISEFPEMFRQYDDEHRFAVLRRFPYSVVYQVHPSRIIVIAVAHSRRAEAYWRGRR